MDFKILLTYGRMQNINDRDVKFNQTLQKKYNITQYDFCRNFKLLTEEQWKKITL